MLLFLLFLDLLCLDEALEELDEDDLDLGMIENSWTINILPFFQKFTLMILFVLNRGFENIAERNGSNYSKYNLQSITDLPHFTGLIQIMAHVCLVNLSKYI